MVEEAFKLLLQRLRPQLISLTEIHASSDKLLMSAIGNSYGDIYETHLEWAKNSRLNDAKNGSIMPGWKENMMPIIHAKL